VKVFKKTHTYQQHAIKKTHTYQQHVCLAGSLLAERLQKLTETGRKAAPRCCRSPLDSDIQK
jgi:hypothetical protein